MWRKSDKLSGTHNEQAVWRCVAGELIYANPDDQNTFSGAFADLLRVGDFKIT